LGGQHPQRRGLVRSARPEETDDLPSWTSRLTPSTARTSVLVDRGLRITQRATGHGACPAASNALALTTKIEDVMAPVIKMVMMPVLLLSGNLLPMTIGPGWLECVSDFMPIRHIVDAVGNSFMGDFETSGTLWGTGWAVPLFGLALWWGTYTFRKENT